MKLWSKKAIDIKLSGSKAKRFGDKKKNKLLKMSAWSARRFSLGIINYMFILGKDTVTIVTLVSIVTKHL